MTASNYPYPKVCIFCQKVFEARKNSTLYCSHQCNRRAYKENQRQKKLTTANEQFQKDLVVEIQKVQARHVLSLAQVAHFLGVSRWTVNRYIRTGKLNTIKFMGRTLVLKSEIDAILNKK